MICPKCGSGNVLSQPKQAMNITVKMKRGNGCLWWLLFGWLYLSYIALVWMFKFMYWLCVGWWVDIIKKSNQARLANTLVHVCQNCGHKYESIS